MHYCFWFLTSTWAWHTGSPHPSRYKLKLPADDNTLFATLKPVTPRTNNAIHFLFQISESSRVKSPRRVHPCPPAFSPGGPSKGSTRRTWGTPCSFRCSSPSPVSEDRLGKKPTAPCPRRSSPVAGGHCDSFVSF